MMLPSKTGGTAFFSRGPGAQQLTRQTSSAAASTLTLPPRPLKLRLTWSPDRVTDLMRPRRTMRPTLATSCSSSFPITG